MSIEDVLTDVIRREGGAVTTDDPADDGGRTQYGISERSNPAAWADGKVTEAEAREIYRRKYVEWPKFHLIEDSQLQMQCIDFGVHSGPQLVIQKLQEIVGVDVDGILGPQTLAAIKKLHPDDVNTALVIARVKMIGRIVTKSPTQIKYLNGFLNRALEFLK